MAHQVYYFVPEDGDEEKHPNVYTLPPNSEVDLGVIQQTFPLAAAPGEVFVFRFKFRWKKGYVWLDLSSQNDPLPLFDGRIVMKVSRIFSDENSVAPPQQATSTRSKSASSTRSRDSKQGQKAESSSSSATGSSTTSPSHSTHATGNGNGNGKATLPGDNVVSSTTTPTTTETTASSNTTKQRTPSVDFFGDKGVTEESQKAAAEADFFAATHAPAPAPEPEMELLFTHTTSETPAPASSSSGDASGDLLGLDFSSAAAPAPSSSSASSTTPASPKVGSFSSFLLSSLLCCSWSCWVFHVNHGNTEKGYFICVVYLDLNTSARLLIPHELKSVFSFTWVCVVHQDDVFGGMMFQGL